jgi:hypothetical protein
MNKTGRDFRLMATSPFMDTGQVLVGMAAAFKLVAEWWVFASVLAALRGAGLVLKRR